MVSIEMRGLGLYEIILREFVPETILDREPFVELIEWKTLGRPFFIVQEYVNVGFRIEGYVEPPSITELVKGEVSRRGLKDRCNAYAICSEPREEPSWLRKDPNQRALVEPTIRCHSIVDITYAVQLYKVEEADIK